MKRIHLLVLLSVLALPLFAASARGSGSGGIVVAQVFAAGGNSGAAYSKAKDDPGPCSGMTLSGGSGAWVVVGIGRTLFDLNLDQALRRLDNSSPQSGPLRSEAESARCRSTRS
jgi:hypothetical protein